MKQQAIPAEINDNYFFDNGNAYRIMVDPAIELIDGKKAHRLRTVNCGPEERLLKQVPGADTDSPVSAPVKENAVAKMVASSKPLPEQKHDRIMQQTGKGRPLKEGKVNRSTLWRRQKKERQGNLL